MNLRLSDGLSVLLDSGSVHLFKHLFEQLDVFNGFDHRGIAQPLKSLDLHSFKPERNNQIKCLNGYFPIEWFLTQIENSFRWSQIEPLSSTEVIIGRIRWPMQRHATPLLLLCCYVSSDSVQTALCCANCQVGARANTTVMQ